MPLISRVSDLIVSSSWDLFLSRRSVFQEEQAFFIDFLSRSSFLSFHEQPLLFLRCCSSFTGSYLASFLLSIEIQVMNYFYKNLAVLTTKWENHRTDTIFEDVLIAKLAIFLVSLKTVGKPLVSQPSVRYALRVHW